MLYSDALPVDNYQIINDSQKTFCITNESFFNPIEKFGKDFFMKKNFQVAKEVANERYYRMTGKRVSEENLSKLDNLLSAYLNTHILISFDDNQIKTIFTLDNVKYFIDFYYDEDYAHVGKKINNNYSLLKVPLAELNDYIAYRK